jgi:flagellar hook-associated protein 2
MTTIPTTTTTTSSTSALSALNISGLASGLDTNSIVTQLMAIEKIPQDRIVQKQTLETTRQTDLKAIQSQLTLLSSALTTLTSPSTWTTSQAVTSSDPTHVSATGVGVPIGGFQVSVSQLARSAQLTQSTALQTAAGNDQLTVQVGPDPTKAFTVNVTAGDSLDKIARAINLAGTAQVYASVVNSKLVVSSQVPGAANTIALTSSGGGTLAADLGFTQTVAPRDAIYAVDGGANQTSASNVITNIASGLTVTLLGVTASPASIAVSPAASNTDAVKSAISNYISTYNDTVDMISAKVKEPKVVNPQTDADRAKGDLRGDPSLVSLLSRLRSSAADLVTGRPANMNSVALAGVSTGAAVSSGTLNASSIQGDLTLDATKLTNALASNFDDVKALFTNVTGSYDSEGLVQRQNRVLNTFIGTGGVLSSAIASQTTRINQLATQKASWDTRLAQREATLRQQYTAMETALSSAQSQGTWLTGQINSLPKF